MSVAGGSRKLKVGLGGLLGLGLLLLVPDCEPEPPVSPGSDPFVWGQDDVWSSLEQGFLDARARDCPEDLGTRREGLTEIASRLHDAAPDDPRWAELETGFFELASATGGCPEQLDALLELRRVTRIAIKDASRGWEKNRAARERLYRTLYGSRTAVEELILQLPADRAPALSRGREVPSTTPSIEIEGVRVHSGDLLLSRGGAPTSAFISRGNDFPGNFSHVALVHVSENGEASVIEAHIEKGVAIATPERYFADKKLRILVLRLPPEHPALAADPSLPHLAASAALDRARAEHIPYDFAMDFLDDEKQFCSEVASAAYRDQDVVLWDTLSTFSSPGLAAWMTGFGVRNLETQAPSDLEYDPQLQVVAEWHDPETLFRDHVDNAVIDAMIERAEQGARLEHAWYLLPAARLAKAYSVGLNLVGKEGPVPEGMTATIALRATWLENRHREAAERVIAAAEEFEASKGYRPPYWELVRMAREG